MKQALIILVILIILLAMWVISEQKNVVMLDDNRIVGYSDESVKKIIERGC